MHEQNPIKERSLLGHLVKLARVKQWTKSVFVLIGPFYALSLGEAPAPLREVILQAGLAALAFALASSGLYVINDVQDAEADRAHPRKRRRPIASGAVTTRQGVIFAFGLWILAGLTVALMPAGGRPWVLGLLAMHMVNVLAYSFRLKHIAIVDVISLSMGFVLRVLAGCAAVGVTPSTWLLNSTLFLSMFLAFGKRLGERQSMGDNAVAVRGVLGAYSLDLLRMVVVVSAVATLLTYAGYVQSREDVHMVGLDGGGFRGGFGINVLWLTVFPAVYALLRAIMLLEQGRYDDPTELAVKDPPFQLSAAAFGVVTLAIAWPAIMNPG